MTTISPLTGKFHDIIYGDGDWSKFYDSRFKARRGVMLHAVNKGWTLEQCRLVFLNQANPGSELWTRAGTGKRVVDAKQLKTLKDDYMAASAKIAESPPVYDRNDARARIGEYIAVVKSSDWLGVSGRTDRDVLLYICKKMTELGSTFINISTRDISIGAGVSKSTPGISLERLSRAGWIHRTKPDRPGHAGGVSLIMSKVQSHGWAYNPLSCRDNMPDCETFETPTDAGHETWVRLGKPAKDVYSHLQDYPRSADDLAKLSGVPRSTTYKKLPKLISNGLARKVAGGYVLGPLTPDDAAEANTWVEDNSKVQQRKDLYAAQRQMHTAKLEVYERLPKTPLRREKPHEAFTRIYDEWLARKEENERLLLIEMLTNCPSLQTVWPGFLEELESQGRAYNLRKEENNMPECETEPQPIKRGWARAAA